MSYNGSGVFQVNTGGQPVANGTTIDPTVFNNYTSDVANGLSTAICKDGQTTITANLPMNSKKLTGLADGSARSDSATIGNVVDGTGIYIATVGGTADVITLTPVPVITAYTTGQTFRFIASGANTTNVTVNISGLGAKAITKNGTTALAAGDIASAMMVEITYDGTRFILQSAVTSIINNPTLVSPTLSGTPVFPDNVFTVVGSADATKKVAFEVDGLTTATTRTQYVSDEDSSAGQSWDVKNCTLVATVGANALTVALKTRGGADFSASAPLIVKFRNATAGTGDYSTLLITSALSMTVSSGSTLDTVNAVPHRIYIGIANDAGTARLFVYNPLASATLSLLSLDEGVAYSSTAEGGVGAADSSQVLYSGTAFTSKSVVLVGYVESTQATAGTWATTPSRIHLLTPRSKRTGDTVQVALITSSAVATGSTATPGVGDDTIPQITEGNLFFTKAIVPTNSINILRHETLLNLAIASADQITVHLHQDATANALVASQMTLSTANRVDCCPLAHEMQAGTTSSTSFTVRAGAHTGAVTLTLNGSSGARQLGGVIKSYYRITEIMV